MRRGSAALFGLVALLVCGLPSIASASLSYGSKAEVAWARGYTGAGQTIAVIDTGVNAKHRWFDGGAVSSEACFSADSGVLRSLCGGGVPSPLEAFGPGAAMPKTRYGATDLSEWHGTSVTGAAVGAERRVSGFPSGLRGLAPDASVVGIKVTAWRPPGGKELNTQALARALTWLADRLDEHPLAAVNLSFGFKPVAATNVSTTDGDCDAAARRDLRMRAAQDAIKRLVDEGVSVIAGAGNRANDPATFPACLSTVIAVGAATEDGDVPRILPSWPVIDVLAPGVEMKLPVVNGELGVSTGSSYAAPSVAAAIALYKQRRPRASVDEIRDRLASTGKKVEMRPGVERRFLQVDQFLGIRAPSGAIRPACLEPRLDAGDGTVHGYFRLRCPPGDARLDRIAVTLDGPNVNRDADFAPPDPSASLDWYLKRPLLVGPPAGPGEPGSYRLCALLYTKAQPIWPASTVCEEYEV